MTFTGFARGLQYTPVPSPLLGPLLEKINDLAELKCTLRAMWLIHQKKGKLRFVPYAELKNDRVLQRAFQGLSESPGELIDQGLSMAVDRGTLICLRVTEDSQSKNVYLLNTEANRLGAIEIKPEQLNVPTTALIEDMPAIAPDSKPNIFKLYEENIGILTPMIVETLIETENVYPEQWVEEAFQIAVERNQRNLRYIQAILQRWATEGKDNGESRRHFTKTDREKYRKEYLRRRGLLHYK